MKIPRILLIAGLCALVLFGLCAFAFYGLLRLLGPYRPAVLFYGYLAPMAAIVIWNLVLLLRRASPVTVTGGDQMRGFFMGALDQTSRWTKFRLTVGSDLEFLSNLVSWPVLFASALLRHEESGRSVTALVAVRGLHTPQVTRAGYSLALVVMTTWFGGRWPGAPAYAARFLYTVVISIVLKHIAYTVGASALPQMLRRSHGNPYVRGLWIAVFDFLTLVIAFSTILASGPASPLLTRYFFVAQQIFAFQSFWDLFRAGKITHETLLIAIAGVAFSSGVFKAAIKWREFQRVDDDHHTLAKLHLFLGRYKHALTVLSEVKNASAVTHALYVVAYIGVGEIDKARRSSQLAARLGGREPAEDETWLALFHCAAFWTLPEDEVFAVVRHALRAGISDLFLSSGLNLILGTSPKSAPTTYELLRAFAADSKPLSTALVLMTMDRRAEAVRRLDGLTLTDPTAEFVRKYLLLMAELPLPEISEDEAGEKFAAWLETELPLAASVAGNDESKKWIVLGVLEQLKQGSDEIPELQERLESVAAELRRDIEAHDSSKETAAILQKLARYKPPVQSLAS